MCTGGSQKRIDGPHSVKYSTGVHRLIDPLHNVIHRTCNILTDCTADSHTCHHCSHIKAVTTTAEVYIAGAVRTHLPK